MAEWREAEGARVNIRTVSLSPPAVVLSSRLTCKACKHPEQPEEHLGQWIGTLRVWKGLEEGREGNREKGGRFVPVRPSVTQQPGS
jgi:hypothetical protein